MKKILSKLKNAKGQSSVEFALIGILLLIILFGITEFGRAWYRADKLKGAANIAARTYAITKDYSQALSAAQTVIPSLTVISADTTTIQVTVSVSETFNPVVALFPMLNNITITRTATYRLE